MTLTLVFDTSADVCAAGLFRNGEPLAVESREMTRGHAEALVPLVLAVCAQSGVRLPDCERIGVTVGPGSFTGVRTGLAAARGFAAATGARAVGVSSLEAAAYAARAGAADAAARIVVLLETRRQDYYAQIFRADGAPLGAASVLGMSEISAAIAPGDMLAGNAVDRFLGEVEALPDGAPGRLALDPDGPVTRASGCGAVDLTSVAALADKACESMVDQKKVEHSLAPLYLRAPEAKLPKDGGQLRK